MGHQARRVNKSLSENSVRLNPKILHDFLDQYLDPARSNTNRPAFIKPHYNIIAAIQKNHTHSHKHHFSTCRTGVLHEIMVVTREYSYRHQSQQHTLHIHKASSWMNAFISLRSHCSNHRPVKKLKIQLDRNTIELSDHADYNK